MSKKILKIMGDYSSSGLWEGKYGGMIDTDTLEIPDTLKKRIKIWAKNWDTLFSSISYFEADTNLNLSKIRKKNYIFYQSKDFRKIYFEQKIIAKLLKKYLGNDFDIYFFDELILFLGHSHLTYLYRI